MNKPMAQKILNRNKGYISTLLDMLEQTKVVKRYADETGALQQEYAAHNALKVLRKEIADLVLEQKYLKSIVNAKGN